MSPLFLGKPVTKKLVTFDAAISNFLNFSQGMNGQTPYKLLNTLTLRPPTFQNLFNSFVCKFIFPLGSLHADSKTKGIERSCPGI